MSSPPSSLHYGQSSFAVETHGTDERLPRRVPMACTSCRKRKVRCDGRKPGCVNCERRDVQCTYVSVADEQQGK
ncbi:Zn(II)2Cys6 transcription factor [Phanerochaete sordida]|uniref:Zn(II)2Cys6 transcription factor n=1 Tax=Phanerochaete sordida TaxID=48140 RepID=A0A9P3LBX0_9APHY|nr:Zn(II)2Cys6 transcription factor [Phanerochaete sordida]